MRTDDFDFDLPRDLIAQQPASPRDAARLLAVGRELSDHRVRDLPGLLRPGDLLVVNDTQVIPARLTGKRPREGGEGATIEATLHFQTGGSRWQAFARPARKLRPGDRIDFDAGLSAEVEAKAEGGEVTLAFNCGGEALMAALEAQGVMPLPPYIQRDRGGNPQDRHDYQTMFARERGAVAAPTAGLHFTTALEDALRAKDIRIVPLTLHVGAGTFLPVTAERVEDHRMHRERGRLSAETVSLIEQTKKNGGRIVAVGTTVLRLLESAIDCDGRLVPFDGSTDIFIVPGHRFHVADLLMTNFHLPRSTLFHVGLRLLWATAHESGLCPRHCRGISLLLLWGRLPVAAV